jgi:uncharacterized membrane protein YgcG
MALFGVVLIAPSFAKQSGSGSGSGSGSSSASGSGSGSGSGTGSGEGVKLEWKFEKGKAFYQKMVTTTNQTLKLTGNEIKQEQSQTFVYGWTLKEEKSDGDRVFEQKIEGLVMKINIAGQPIEFNSAKDMGGGNPLADFFKNIVGATFTVTFDKNFKVKDVKGKEELIKKLGSQNQQMEQLLNAILNEDAMKELFEPTFSAVPTKPVSKGDTWDRKTTLDMGPIGKYENSYKYTYDGEEDNNQKIKVEADVKYTKPGDMKPGTGLPFKIKDANIPTSKLTGKVVFDPKAGWVKSMDTTLEVSGDLTIEISNQTTKVELKQTQKTSVETSAENPIAPKGSGTGSASGGSGSGSGSGTGSSSGSGSASGSGTGSGTGSSSK